MVVFYFENRDVRVVAEFKVGGKGDDSASVGETEEAVVAQLAVMVKMEIVKSHSTKHRKRRDYLCEF